MELKDSTVMQLALNACSGIIAKSLTSQNDPQTKQHLLLSLECVKNVLDILEKSDRDKNADMAYAMLYDCYHNALNIVNDNSKQELKN